MFHINANTTLLIQDICEKFRTKIYIKSKEKIKKIPNVITNNIIEQIQKANIEIILLMREFFIIVLYLAK